MRAHLVQLNITWEDKPANYRRVERLLSQAQISEGDLIVLPEMFDTGFSLNTDVTADRDGATLRFLAELAEDLNCFVHGARTVHDCHCAKALNRATIVGPRGDLLAEYDKIHPFSYGREPDKFDGGSQIVVYDWASPNAPRGPLRVCPSICYDLRFPELFRLGLLRGAQVFVIGANWPEARAAHWSALLVARAIENQAFVLGVNRVGADPNLRYRGGSAAIGPRGEVLAQAGEDETVLSVEIDPGTMHAWREQFPAWRDARLIHANEHASPSRAL